MHRALDWPRHFGLTGQVTGPQVLAYELIVATSFFGGSELMGGPRHHPGDVVGDGQEVRDVVTRYDDGASLPG